jgi:shikimate dehydrogenase
MSDVLKAADLATLTADPALYGVIGHPVGHSLSPAMQLAAFQAAGIPAQYPRLELSPDDLPAAVEAMRRKPFSGWNCTVPHKAAMLALVDARDATAEAAGGANTVLNENGHLTGFSTDGTGWVRAIREDFGLDVRDLRVLVLGAGGAGQAIARQCALEGCERLVIANRTFEKARAWADQLVPHFRSTKLLGADLRLKAVPLEEAAVARELHTIDLIVNGTSSGLRPSDPPVLPARVIQPHLCVYDTIYRPARTGLLRAAQEAGARTANGLSMLLHQGALAWEIWTGRTAPLEAMRAALKAAAQAA